MVVRWYRVAALAMLLGILGGGRAGAQDARTLFQRGQEAYSLGQYEAAIDLWRRAYALDPRPALQYNLAQAYGRLARAEQEQEALRVFVEGSLAAGADPADPQLAGARARLAALADRIRRTGVQLSGVPEEAIVQVDGEAANVSGDAAIALSPGPHQITVTREGYEDFNTSIVVHAGETIAVPVTLRRAAVAADEGGHRSGKRIAGILGLSLGGAALATGGVLGGLALRRSDGAIDGTSDADASRSLALGSDVAIGAGAALGITGLVLVLVSRGDDEPAPSVALLPSLGHDHAGIVVSGRF